MGVRVQGVHGFQGQVRARSRRLLLKLTPRKEGGGEHVTVEAGNSVLLETSASSTTLVAGAAAQALVTPCVCRRATHTSALCCHPSAPLPSCHAVLCCALCLYMQEYVACALSDRECHRFSVNERLIRCLTVEPPPPDLKLQTLSEIAQVCVCVDCWCGGVAL